METALTERRLNIGGGEFPIDGFETIDRTTGQDILPYLKGLEDGSIAELYASHVVEHFGHLECNEVLAEFYRVLAPGGRVRLAVPDFDKLCKAHVDGQFNILPYVYGGQTGADDFHRTGFNYDGMRHALRALGFVGIGKWSSDYKDCSRLPVSLNVLAYKPRVKAEDIFKTTKAVGVMSVGRLLFADAVRCQNKVLPKLGIQVIDLTGAFYRQTMEEVLANSVEQNPDLDWVVTFDHDTVFTRDIFLRMATLFDNHPEIDALAPMQAHRDFEHVLAWTDGKKIDHMAEVFPVSTAHFGMTFIRAKKLREFPHPWFYGKPDEHGRWGKGRVDDDIAFWRKWNEFGNNVYVTPRIAVGHIENVILWPGKDYAPVAQPCSDFLAEGEPPEDALC